MKTSPNKYSYSVPRPKIIRKNKLGQEYVSIHKKKSDLLNSSSKSLQSSFNMAQQHSQKMLKIWDKDQKANIKQGFPLPVENIVNKIENKYYCPLSSKDKQAPLIITFEEQGIKKVEYQQNLDKPNVQKVFYSLKSSTSMESNFQPQKELYKTEMLGSTKNDHYQSNRTLLENSQIDYLMSRSPQTQNVNIFSQKHNQNQQVPLYLKDKKSKLNANVIGSSNNQMSEGHIIKKPKAQWNKENIQYVENQKNQKNFFQRLEHDVNRRQHKLGKNSKKQSQKKTKNEGKDNNIEKVAIYNLLNQLCSEEIDNSNKPQILENLKGSIDKMFDIIHSKDGRHIL